MRYLAWFEAAEHGQPGDAVPPGDARRTFDATDVVAAYPVLSDGLRADDQSPGDIRRARHAPAWVRHWAGAFTATLVRVDEALYREARQALAAEFGESALWMVWVNVKPCPELVQFTFDAPEGKRWFVRRANDGSVVVDDIPW